MMSASPDNIGRDSFSFYMQLIACLEIVHVSWSYSSDP